MKRVAISLLLSVVAISAVMAKPQTIKLISEASPKDIKCNKCTFVCEGDNSFRVVPLKGGDKSQVTIFRECDLSDYKAITFTLENLEDKPAYISMCISNTVKSYWKSRRTLPDTVGDIYYLAPREKRKVVLNFPQPLQHPEVDKSFSLLRYTPYARALGINCYSGDLTKTKLVSFYCSHLALAKIPAERGVRILDVKIVPGKRAENPALLKVPYNEFFPFIDVYGQYKYADWKGKVHSDKELQKARETEEADLAKHIGPTDRNKYGGWVNGPRQEATGRFYFKKVDGKWWFVDPEGCLWWSHGVVRVTPSSAVTPLDNRHNYFENLPTSGSEFEQFYHTHDALLKPYYTARNIKETYDFSSANCYRKYGKDYKNVYAELAHRRLKSWGLNTIANSSDKDICLMSKTPYIERLEVLAKEIKGSGGSWWRFMDPWDPSFKQSIINQLKAREKELKDPYLVGLFVDNELKWGDESFLAETVAKNPSSLIAKQQFVNHYKAKYKDKISALNSAWGTSFESWESLLANEEALPKSARKDLVEFNDMIIDKYFRNCREVFNEYAPGVLYLGCRFAGSNKKAITIGAKYCDAVSHNYYLYSLEDYIQPEGLDKPMIIGEFHFGTRDRGPFHHSLLEVKSQKERGKAYETYVRSALEHPNIVGTHWHQFSDQATTGRFDGENFNVGFTDICDTPYYETIKGIRRIGYNMYNIRWKK